MLPVALFGGTFDPIHNGHLRAATEVLNQHLARKVVFIPAGDPWQKTRTLTATTLERAHMVSRAIAPYSNFEISMCEIERNGPTFTIDTAEEFLRNNPGEEFLLMLGSDAFNGIKSWKSYERLLGLVDILVAIRPGEKLEEVSGAYVTKIESSMFDISSTIIRQAAMSGADLTQLVPKEILEEVQRIYGVKA